MKELTARRELNQGFGNALSQAVELVGAPMLFAGAGWLLDRWLGWSPVLMIVLGLYGLFGAVARIYFGYAARMRQHEANAPWTRSKAAKAARR